MIFRRAHDGRRAEVLVDHDLEAHIGCGYEWVKRSEAKERMLRDGPESTTVLSPTS
jgi:hypothetical protein